MHAQFAVLYLPLLTSLFFFFLFAVVSRNSDLQMVTGKLSGKWKPDGNKHECGTRNSIENLLGARIAGLGEFKWTALLGYDHLSTGEIFYTCGGSLINKWYVLTAANCIGISPKKQPLRLAYLFAF